MSNKLGEFFDPAGNENNAVVVTHSAVVPPPGPLSQLPSAIPSTSGGGNQFVFESIQDGDGDSKTFSKVKDVYQASGITVKKRVHWSCAEKGGHITS